MPIPEPGVPGLAGCCDTFTTLEPPVPPGAALNHQRGLRRYVQRLAVGIAPTARRIYLAGASPERGGQPPPSHPN